MPQLLSLVGKALGNILRVASGSDASGRGRGSINYDNGNDWSERAASAPGPGHTLAASGSSSGHRISAQSCSLRASDSPIRPFVEAGSADIGTGTTTTDRSNAADSAAPTAASSIPCDISIPGSCSPAPAPAFFRASRASLSDTTASAAGESLRQASMTNRKANFTRDNLVSYMRWVRASRGAMKLAGKVPFRSPSPTLLLRCEHWLEVTDDQHRYGSNLRVYFDFWVAEMEAAELTPPPSPAMMSPSPSCSHLVALAPPQQQQQQQEQQQQHAGAYAERISPNQGLGLSQQSSQQQHFLPQPQQQQVLQAEQLQQQQAALQYADGSLGQSSAGPHSAGGSPGLGAVVGTRPSRFSADATPRVHGFPEHPHQQQDQQQHGQHHHHPHHLTTAHHLNHTTQHHHHQVHVRSKHKHLHWNYQLPLSEQPRPHGEQRAPVVPADGSQQQHQQQHEHRRQHHHHQHSDVYLYEREGSVHRGTGDGDSASVTADGAVASVTSPGPLSPADVDVDSAVGCVAGGCNPPSITAAVKQQQRRHSCGEGVALQDRHPAAPPRPSSSAISVTAMAAAAAAAPPALPPQPTCCSPHRNSLCSPSKRFVLAAMIDMSPVDQAPSSEQEGGRQQQQQQQGADPVAHENALTRQLQGTLAAGNGAGAGAAAAAPPAPSGAVAAQGGEAVPCAADQGAPPATPQPQAPVLGAAETPAARAVSCGGAAHAAVLGGFTAQRAAKLLSTRGNVGNGSSFFRWLDTGPGLDVDLTHLGVPRAKLDAERVKYLTPLELLEYELDVDMDTGLLRYKRSGKLLHTGPDGRGSVDEHRRPPTPPPPAVPLSLLGEGAAAWWRGSAAAAELPPPPGPQAAASSLNPAVINTRAGGAFQSRHSSRAAMVMVMETVPEAAGCEELSQSGLLSGDAAIGAAAATVARQEDARERALDVAAAAAGGGGRGNAATALLDLELRGHSASSLASLERSRVECCSPRASDSQRLPGSSPGDSGSGSGDSRPGSSAVAAAAAAAGVMDSAGVAAQSKSAGEVTDGGGARAAKLSTLALEAEADDDEAAVTAKRLVFESMDDAESVTAVGVEQLERRGGQSSAEAPQQLAGIATRATAMDASDLPTTPAAAAAIGPFTPAPTPAPTPPPHAPAGGPKTPGSTGAAAAGGGAGGGGHHEDKVAKWIYVVDPELRLYVHPKVRGRFHHSSFLRGGAVVAAGGLAARHGRLRLLTADSGHYWPREENYKWLCEHLVSVGADLSSCDLRSKHMKVPANTGKELMEKMGVPPPQPWRLPFQPASSLSPSLPPLEQLPSPMTEHAHLLQLQDMEMESRLGGMGM